MNVILVFVNHTTLAVSPERAMELCRDPAVAGRLMDALTPDRSLQSKLRWAMDNVPDPVHDQWLTQEEQRRQNIQEERLRREGPVPKRVRGKRK